MVFVAGMIGWDGDCKFHSLTMHGQVRQALQNIVDVPKAGNAKAEHIVRMTWYRSPVRAKRARSATA
jgi:enamine deaminase RidA (YjgF/YER057c/UK114 family)